MSCESMKKIKQLKYTGTSALAGKHGATTRGAYKESSNRKNMIGVPNIPAIEKYFNARSGTFTKSMKNISTAIIRQPDILKNNLLVTFAESLKLGEASVMRFCKHLGFKGFTEFKRHFIDEFFELPDESDTRPQQYEAEIDDNTTVSEILTKISNLNARIILETKQNLAASNVQLLELGHHLLMAPRVLICGDSYNNAFIQEVSQRFTNIGITCFTATEAYDLASKSQILQKGDIAICLSASGHSPEVARTFNLLRKQRVITVAICCDKNSETATASDICFQSFGYYEKAYNIVPESLYVRISQMIILECLMGVITAIAYVAITERRQNVKHAVEQIANSVKFNKTTIL